MNLTQHLTRERDRGSNAVSRKRKSRSSSGRRERREEMKMTPQPPTPLSILNQPSTNLPPAKEYSLKHWLSSATTIHNQFTNDWNEAKKVNDPLLVESAYKALRKFAELASFPLSPRLSSLLTMRLPWDGNEQDLETGYGSSRLQLTLEVKPRRFKAVS